MKKLVTIICVVAWSGFWAFGYIALTASAVDEKQRAVALGLAALGFLSGSYAYLKLAKGTPAP